MKLKIMALVPAVLAAAVVLIASPAWAAGGNVGFGFNAAGISGFPTSAAFLTGGGAFNPGTGFAKSALESVVAEVQELSEITSSSVKDALSPINERVTAFVDNGQRWRSRFGNTGRFYCRVSVAASHSDRDNPDDCRAS